MHGDYSWRELVYSNNRNSDVARQGPQADEDLLNPYTSEDWQPSVLDPGPNPSAVDRLRMREAAKESPVEDLVFGPRAAYKDAWLETGEWLIANFDRLKQMGPACFGIVMAYNKIVRAMNDPSTTDHYKDLEGYAHLVRTNKEMHDNEH